MRHSSSPTYASLQRAKNPLAQYPEFQELRSAVGSLQRDSFDALRLEEASSATLQYLGKQLKLTHRGIHMLTDLVVDEFSRIKHDISARDATVDALLSRLENQEIRTSELMTWSKTEREDVADLRRAVERELARETRELLAALARQTLKHEELAKRVRSCEVAVSEHPSDAAVLSQAVAVARQEGAKAATRALREETDHLRSQNSLLAGRLDDMRRRCDSLETHVIELVDLLKTRVVFDQISPRVPLSVSVPRDPVVPSINVASPLRRGYRRGAVDESFGVPATWSAEPSPLATAAAAASAIDRARLKHGLL